jgi:uncharacterized protein YggU (UPF0235/DUF167 family)
MYIKVKVKTGMKKESLTEISKLKFEVSVREVPERNEANQSVIALISSHFKIPKKSVHIVSGHHAPSKLLQIPD